MATATYGRRPRYSRVRTKGEDEEGNPITTTEDVPRRIGRTTQSPQETMDYSGAGPGTLGTSNRRWGEFFGGNSMAGAAMGESPASPSVASAIRAKAPSAFSANNDPYSFGNGVADSMYADVTEKLNGYLAANKQPVPPAPPQMQFSQSDGNRWNQIDVPGGTQRSVMGKYGTGSSWLPTQQSAAPILAKPFIGDETGNRTSEFSPRSRFRKKRPLLT